MVVGAAKMKATVLHEHGHYDRLQYDEEVLILPLKTNEVRIQVKYCGLNHLDIWLRKGGTGDRLTLPRIPGSDVVGVIKELGSEVTHLQLGDYVVLYPGKGCGSCKACSHSRETMCKEFNILGYHTDGGYAEYVTTEAKHAIKITNDHLEEWAGVPISYVTAWNALVKKGKLKASDTVVIWGASGGLGYAALSIAKHFGANVIGIVSSQNKIDFLKTKGFKDVHFVIRDENVTKTIRALTNKEGADLVLDHVGKKTFNTSLQMLSRGGRLAFCGITTGPIAETDLRLIFGKQLTITGSWMGDLSDFVEVVDFLERTKAFPHIDEKFSLKNAAYAQEFLEKGTHIGKIILSVGD